LFAIKLNLTLPNYEHSASNRKASLTSIDGTAIDRDQKMIEEVGNDQKLYAEEVDNDHTLYAEALPLIAIHFCSLTSLLT